MHCSKLTEEVRLDIFNAFWKMNWKEKKIFVASMVDKKATASKTKTSNSRRSDTNVYYLKVHAIRERVCLKSFLGTLGIKEWTVRYWLGEKSNATNNVSVTENESQAKESKNEMVKKYLTALPKLPSHYCRQSTSKLYLEPVIQSKAQLYRLYSDYSQSRNEPVVSRKLFESVLFEENIGLYTPKKDACDVCCAHKAGNLSDEQFKNT